MCCVYTMSAGNVYAHTSYIYTNPKEKSLHALSIYCSRHIYPGAAQHTICGQRKQICTGMGCRRNNERSMLFTWHDRSACALVLFLEQTPAARSDTTLSVDAK